MKKVTDFEKLMDKEFSKTHGYHHFSKKYTQRKNDFLNSITSNKRFNWHSKKVAIAAAIVFIGLPTTVYAATRWYATQQQYKVTMSLKENKSNRKDFFKLNLGYIPNNMIENSGKYSYKNNINKGGFSFTLWKVNSQADFIELNANDYSEVVFGKNKAYQINKVASIKNSDTSFDRVVYLLFEKEGYVLQSFIGNDVPEADLKEVMSNISLEKTTKDQAYPVSEYEESSKNSEYDDGISTSKLATNSKTIFSVGQTIENKSFDDISFDYTINKVEVLDNLNNMSIGNFNSTSLEILRQNNIVGENMALFPYFQKKIKLGDGVTTVDQVESTQKIIPKFVYVTATIENKNGTDIEELYLQNAPKILKKEGDYWVQDFSWGETDVSAYSGEVDYLDSHGEGKSFYKLPIIQSNEKRVIHFGYFVDANQLDKLFLPTITSANTDDLSDENINWIDIRQPIN